MDLVFPKVRKIPEIMTKLRTEKWLEIKHIGKAVYILGRVESH